MTRHQSTLIMTLSFTFLLYLGRCKLQVIKEIIVNLFPSRSTLLLYLVDQLM